MADSPTLAELRERGARVHVGHASSHVDGATEVVLSSAIAPDNPELQAAKERGIPVRHRSEILAELLNQKEGVTVAGAHGKTTVTSMIVWVLHRLGERPTFLIGGELPELGGAQYGDGSLLIAEADESDRTFLRYQPRIVVVTSIEPDHLENYNGSFVELKEAYARYLDNIKPEAGASSAPTTPTCGTSSKVLTGRNGVLFGTG